MCQGYPRRPGPTKGAVARVVTQSATSTYTFPTRGHREARKGSERASGSLPRPASGGQLVAGRSSRLGIPEFITGLRVAKLKLSLREPPARAAECCFPGRFREAGSRGTCGRRSGRPGWERGRRAGGGCPGRARPQRLPGKFSWWRKGWRPGQE